MHAPIWASFELKQMSWWQTLSFILPQKYKNFGDMAESIVYKCRLHIVKHVPNLNIYLSIFTLHRALHRECWDLLLPCQSTCLPHQHFLTAPAVPHKYMLSNKYCAVYNNWHTHIYRSLEIHVLQYAYDVKYTNSVLNIISSNFARLWTKIQLSLSSVNLGIFHCALIVHILPCSWFSFS